MVGKKQASERRGKKRLMAYVPRAWAAVGAALVLAFGLGVSFLIRKTSLASNVLGGFLVGVFGLLFIRAVYPTYFEGSDKDRSRRA